MSMQANDETMPHAIAHARCGQCAHWGRRRESGRGLFSLGLCYVQRGEMSIYSTELKLCDVQVRGEFLFKPLQVPA